MPKERDGPSPLGDGVYWYINIIHINNLKMSQLYESLKERNGISRVTIITIIIIQRLGIFSLLTVCCELHNKPPSSIILVPQYG